MRKQHIFILLALLIIVVLSGCATDKGNKALEDMNGLELMHEMAKGGNYEPIEVDYDKMPEDEFRTRAVIEAYDIFWVNKDDYKEEDQGAKYGIDFYWRGDNWISFDSIDDMETVIRNQDFREDFYGLFNIQLEPDAYYLIEDVIGLDAIDLFAIDNNYYFSIKNTVLTEDIKDTVVGGVFDTNQDIDPKETAQLYAELCGAELHNETLSDGSSVYYYSGKRDKLVEAMGIGTSDTATAYLWGQDGVLGVIVVPGGHRAECLDWCKLGRHDLLAKIE